MVVLHSKSAMYISNNGKDIKHTRHIPRRIHFVINGEKCKMHKIDWCYGDIATNNVSEPDITPRMKYIMVILEN